MFAKLVDHNITMLVTAAKVFERVTSEKSVGLMFLHDMDGYFIQNQERTKKMHFSFQPTTIATGVFAFSPEDLAECDYLGTTVFHMDKPESEDALLRHIINTFDL